MRRRTDRGATLVEFSLILPVMVMVILGTLELGLAFKDFLTVSAISREAARIGALAGDDAWADCAILVGVADMATTGDLTRITEIQIYKADEGTGNQGVTNTATYNGGDPMKCSVPADVDDGWDINSSIWPPTSRQATVGATPLDIIGVRVILDRSWVTGFPPFNGSFQVDEATITRLEPQVFEK